jgi:hypothetical protein
LIFIVNKTTIAPFAQGSLRVRLSNQHNKNAGTVHPAPMLGDRPDKFLKNGVHSWGIFTDYSQQLLVLRANVIRK